MNSTDGIRSSCQRHVQLGVLLRLEIATESSAFNSYSGGSKDLPTHIATTRQTDYGLSSLYCIFTNASISYSDT